VSKVAVVAAGDDLERAVEEAFAPFGGAAALLGGRSEADIKVNAVDFKPHTFTDPGVLRAAIRVLRRAGARRVYVIENCTQGNFTRLVFRVSGLERTAKEEGALPVYLDEGPQVPVYLPNLGDRVRVSAWVKERLIQGRDRVFYLNLPKLKTHLMAGVTLGVKNQLGLVMQEDRIRDHNQRLHRKLADIFCVVRPDFTLIEGLYAFNHGHYAPAGLQERCVEKLGALVAGEDTLAADAVGTRIMGLDPREVEHLALAAEDGLGEIDPDRIEVIGDMAPFLRRYTWEMLDEFPPGVRLLKGAEKCCPEGCLLNTLAVLQMLYVDFRAEGDFSILMGKGWDPEVLLSVGGGALVVGDCACEEAYPVLAGRLGSRRVRRVEGCNNLRDIIASLAYFSGVSPLRLVPLPPWESAWLLLLARLNRTTARIPPLLAWPPLRPARAGRG
jgi:uncharacterized protein (DUF362 family)